VSYNNCQLTGGNDIVSGFAHYFSSVYNNNLSIPSSTYHASFPSLNNSAEVNLHSCQISLTDILNEFDLITNKNNPGPDMISNLFFTNCKFVLASP